MHKFYRSVLLTGMVAVGLAGCGDDVTIVEPPPPPPPPAPTVKSISVAPNPGNVPIGGTITMSAAVVADAGVATTVTWSSSDPAKATVNATSGVVTGVSTGSVAITARSTVAPEVSGNATVNVTAAPAKATISIQSVTTAGGVPVVLAAVAGQINVALNLDRGGENVQRVELLLGTKVVGSQVFAAAVSGEEDVQAAVEVIVIPVNTASFNATTGVVDHFNGTTTLSARVITAQNLQGSASPSLSLTLANVSFVAVTTAVLNGSSANGPAGVLWQTGDLRATALPVIYAAGSPAIQQIVLTPSGGGLLAKTLTAAPYVATWAKGTTLATGGAGSGNTGAEVAGLTVGATSTVGGAAGPVGTSAALNFDTQAPTVPAVFVNPNGRQNGWVNDAVNFVAVNTGATSNNMITAASTDAGVSAAGGIAITYAAKAAPGAIAGALAATDITNPTSLAPSNANEICLVVYATDGLGNRNNNPTGACAATTQSTTIGVDRAAPTIAFSGGLGANAQLNGGAVGLEFQVTVADTGSIGNSGMLSGSAVRGTVQGRSATLTPPSAASCSTAPFVGSFASGVCSPISVNATPPFPLVPTTSIAAATTVGYYTYVAFAQDAAGNQSAPLTRVIAYDPVAPALTSALFNVPLTGPTVVFNANASDNFDLSHVTYTMTYAGGLAGPIVFPNVTLNTFNTAPLVNTNVPAGITINGFMRQVQNVTGVNPLTVGGAFKPTALDGVATDMGLNPSATANTVIPGASVTTGVSYTAAAAAQLINSWAITAPAAAVNISRGAGTGGPAGAALNVTFNVDAFGPTATFNPPFSRVDFYRVVGGNLVQIGSTTTFSTVDDGSAQGRRHRYSFNWTPGSSVAAGAQTIYAIGVNSVGDALVTAANGNVTIVNNP